MPSVQNNSVVPKKQASKVWRYLGDNLDGAIAKCLLCTYNPTKGDAHKSSLVNRYSSLQVSLGHQGLPRLHQSLEKPPASTKQEGYGEGGGVGGGEEVQGAPRSEERSLSNCCLVSCPQWTSCGEASRDSVPLLAKLVKRVFPVPATSSKFERVFSVAGNVVTPIRANLNPEKVEDLVVVKCNSRLLKSMGFIRK